MTHDANILHVSCANIRPISRISFKSQAYSLNIITRILLLAEVVKLLHDRMLINLAF